jgi:hypothetical protein
LRAISRAGGAASREAFEASEGGRGKPRAETGAKETTDADDRRRRARIVVAAFESDDYRVDARQVLSIEGICIRG